VPLYEYVCGACAREFEELVSGGAVPRCPHCGADRARRILSVVSIGRSDERAVPAVGPCGTCGDPRGPGACSTS
jgi:putative FmdB family regulatory protein